MIKLKYIMQSVKIMSSCIKYINNIFNNKAIMV